MHARMRYSGPPRTCHAMLPVPQVRQAGMYVGIALKPGTPAEAVVPYVEQGLVDMVGLVCLCRTCAVGVSCLPMAVPHPCDSLKY